MENFVDNLKKIEQLTDGSTIYEVDIPSEQPEIIAEPSSNSINLAVDFPEEGLKKLAQFLLGEIESDIRSQQKSRNVIQQIRPFLGWDGESKDESYLGKHGNKTYDHTLGAGLLRYVTKAYSEIFGREEITTYKTRGLATPEFEERGELLADFMNNFLVVEDSAFREDCQRALYYTGFEGSAYKKVYFDPLLGQPKSRLITPEHFIIDRNCTSILESNRLTHILELSKRDIFLKQKSGIYKDIELSYLKTPDNEENEDKSLNPDSSSPVTGGNDIDLKKTLYVQYETHTYVDLEEYRNPDNINEEKNIPLPYVITIDKTDEKILSIYSNFIEGEIKPKERFFTRYIYLAGFDIDGLGMAHIGGNSAIAITKMHTRLIDAATLQNLPSGFRQKGGTQGQAAEIPIAPAQFPELDTGGVPLRDFFVALPFNGPSPVLRELKLDTINSLKELISSTELGMFESKEDIPANTMLMALEHHNVIQAAVLKSLYESFANELQLLYKVFQRTLPTITFNSKKGPRQISGADFIDEIIIMPACDPSLNSSVQRMMRANTVMSNAMNAPQYYNMPAVLKMNYLAQGIDDQTIQEILKPEPQPQEILPTDPITSVVNIMMGKPVKAFIWQNHPAYILVLGVASQRQEFQSNPELMANLQALMMEHQAYQYYLEMERLLGIQLPPIEEMQDPNIQNNIAIGAANALEASGLANIPQSEGGQLDPNVAAEIQQKQLETEARLEIASQKTELEAFKAALSKEIEEMKLKSDEYKTMEKIASTERETALKAELELVKLQAAEATKYISNLQSQIDFITKQGVKQNDYKPDNENI